MSTIRVTNIESLDAANDPVVFNSDIQMTAPLTVVNKTQAEIDAIASPVRGTIIFNTDEETLTQYNGVKWVEYNQSKLNIGLVVALG
jgi:hypothetical protein